jgi:rare lipoprotein A
MPLPSYARVTNKANGHSVIVRVNDRGPYAHGRVIDLSRRAAQLLDYTQKGTASVVVEYVGRAPVDGADDEYLMASYRPGNGGNADETSPGVMVAMTDQALPGVGQGSALALSGGEPAVPRNAAAAGNLEPYDPFTAEGGTILPAAAPLPDARPSACGDLLRCETGNENLLLSGYADARVAAGHASTLAFGVMKLDERTLRAWQANVGKERILVGVFPSMPDARLVRAIGTSAKVTTEAGEDGYVSVYVQAKDGKATDVLLKRLWKAGYAEAFVIR